MQNQSTLKFVICLVGVVKTLWQTLCSVALLFFIWMSVRMDSYWSHCLSLHRALFCSTQVNVCKCWVCFSVCAPFTWLNEKKNNLKTKHVKHVENIIMMQWDLHIQICRYKNKRCCIEFGILYLLWNVWMFCHWSFYSISYMSKKHTKDINQSNHNVWLKV